jgi:hypothetical protein
MPSHAVGLSQVRSPMGNLRTLARHELSAVIVAARLGGDQRHRKQPEPFAGGLERGVGAGRRPRRSPLWRVRTGRLS